MSQMPLDIARIKPTGDQVLIRRLPDEDKQTRGGVILPAKHRTDFFDAEILAVGPGRKDVGVPNTLEVEEGDIVLVEDNASELVDPRRQRPPHLLPVSMDARDYYLVNFGHVFAVVLPADKVDLTRVQPDVEIDDSESESNLIGSDEPITDIEPQPEETPNANDA